MSKAKDKINITTEKLFNRLSFVRGLKEGFCASDFNGIKFNVRGTNN